MPEPTRQQLLDIAKGAKTQDELVERAISRFGELPDILLGVHERQDLLTEANKVNGQESLAPLSHEIIDAHLSNFEQAYAGRLPNAKAIGFQRNVEGQGLPGTNEWVKQNQPTSNAKSPQPAEVKG